MNKINYIFFGTSEFSVDVLNQLKEAGIIPSLIVTTPDSLQGRGLKLTPCAVKIWANENEIKNLQPERLSGDFSAQLKSFKNQSGENLNWDVFVVVSYGKIIPQEILDLPKRGVLNVHPSLLPKYRGPSPIETAILNDELKTGVTIMLIDEKVDHGPIIVQEIVEFKEWENKNIVSEKLADVGGKILAKILPPWCEGSVESIEQNHDEATFTKKIEKTDAEIKLSDSPRKNFLKIMAYTPHPGAYFFTEKNGKQIRVKIVSAKYKNNTLEILRVIPEGKKEIDYSLFIQQ
ncbi:MAG: methionyl-tRNA formyltransferase [Candidatus Pacebacteria bacterium]|nr:methionyl-tRNA formyltransferase [Candidatus Paceibacterota bacterium]